MAMSTGLDHPVVTAALGAAATATGMQVTFIGGITEVDFTFHRVYGSWDGLADGLRLDRADSFCAGLLAGGPTATADASSEPAYASAAAVSQLGVTSYVGVPIRNAQGVVLGTLCGIDPEPVPVPVIIVEVLRELAAVIAAYLETVPAPGVIIRRTAVGWLVEDGPGSATEGTAEPELITALTLADLLTDNASPPGRPHRPEKTLDPIQQLQVSVAQLEHALAARVVVEQAIGVLVERQHLTPRAAFERLRKAARSRGRRVHLLATEVVASAHAPEVPLPPELAPRRPR